MNWRDVVKNDFQRMGLTWVEVEASAQDIHGVNVWPYVSVMQDESRSRLNEYHNHKFTKE